MLTLKRDYVYTKKANGIATHSAMSGISRIIV